MLDVDPMGAWPVSVADKVSGYGEGDTLPFFFSRSLASLVSCCCFILLYLSFFFILSAKFSLKQHWLRLTSFQIWRLTFAQIDDVNCPGGDEIDWGRRCICPVHVSDQFGQSKFPLSVWILLDPLVGVTHHSNQEIDQNNGCDQQINSKYDLEQAQCPTLQMICHFQVLWSSEAKKGKEESFQSCDWMWDWSLNQ